MNHWELRALQERSKEKCDARSLADVMESVDNGRVVELARYRSQAAVAHLPRPRRMDGRTVARVGQRMANVLDELAELQRELGAERERGCEDAGIYQASLVFTVQEVERVIADFIKEYGGE